MPQDHKQVSLSKLSIVQSTSWEMHINGHLFLWQTPALKVLSSGPLKSRPGFLALRAASIFQAPHHKGFLFLQCLILFIFISICCQKKFSLRHGWEKYGRIECRIQVVCRAWAHCGRQPKYLTVIPRSPPALSSRSKCSTGHCRVLLANQVWLEADPIHFISLKQLYSRKPGAYEWS